MRQNPGPWEGCWGCCIYPGGGGGTRLLNWIGGCRWGGGVKTWPWHIALGARKIHPVTIYLILLKTFKFIPCCNIVLLGSPRASGYTLSDWGCWADKKKKKKKSHRLRLDRGPVIKHYGHAISVINEVVCHSQEGRFWYPVSMVMGHIRPIWYPVPMVMTTLGRFDTLCQYWWPAKSYPVQRHVPITFHNGGAPAPGCI